MGKIRNHCNKIQCSIRVELNIFFVFEFSFFSHYFADLVSPLLIAAQTALLQQLRDRQQSVEQVHFDAAIKNLGRPIHPDDFYILRPDKLFQISSHSDEDTGRSRPASALSLGARLDPRGSDYYARMSLFTFFSKISI